MPSEWADALRADDNSSVGLLLVSWPTEDMFKLNRRLESSGLLVQRQKQQQFMTIGGDSKVTIDPGIYHTNFVGYESVVIAMVTTFLGKALVHSGRGVDSVTVVDVGIFRDNRISDLPRFDDSAYLPLIGNLDQLNEPHCMVV